MAKVEFAVADLTAANRALALAAIEALRPDGNTNIWDGLQKSLDALSSAPPRGNLAAVLLLTDGVPNVEPPRGHLPMLQLYMKNKPNFQFSLHTFGYAYFMLRIFQ